MTNKDPEMLEVAAKFKQFLDDNDVFVFYDNLTEKIYLSHKEKTECIGATRNYIDKYDIPEEIWESDF